MEKVDFHALPRRQLQALCKKHGIPANGTNVSMADALRAIEQQETEKQSAVKEHSEDVVEAVTNEAGSDKLINSSVDLCGISEKEVEGVLEIRPTDDKKCARKASGRTSTRRGCKEAESQSVQPKKKTEPPIEEKAETAAKICFPNPTNPSLQMKADIRYDEADQKDGLRKTRGRAQTRGPSKQEPNLKCIELDEDAKPQLEKARTEAKSSISVSELIAPQKTVEVLDMVVDSEKQKCLRGLRSKASQKLDSEAAREVKSSKRMEDSEAPTIQEKARIDEKDSLLDNSHPAKVVKAERVELESKLKKNSRGISRRNRAGKVESESSKSMNDGETFAVSEDIEPEADRSLTGHMMAEEALEAAQFETGNQKCQKKLRRKAFQESGSDANRETKSMKPTVGAEVAVLEENPRTEDKDTDILPEAERSNSQVDGETESTELGKQCERKVRGRSGARRGCKAEPDGASSQARINVEALPKKENVKPEADNSPFVPHQTPPKMWKSIQHHTENDKCQSESKGYAWEKTRSEEEHTTLTEYSLGAALKEETKVADDCTQQNIGVSDNAQLEIEKHERKLRGRSGKGRASKAKPVTVSGKLKENAEAFALQKHAEPAANLTRSAHETPLQTEEPVQVDLENKICHGELSGNSCKQRDDETRRKVELAFAKQKQCTEAPDKLEEFENEAEENLHLKSEKKICPRQLRGRVSLKVGGKGIELQTIKVEEDAGATQLEAEKDARDKGPTSQQVMKPICVQLENKKCQRQLRGRASSKQDSEVLVIVESAHANPTDCSKDHLKEEKPGIAAEEIALAEEVSALQKREETEVKSLKKGQGKNLRGKACLQLASEVEAKFKCVKVEEDAKALATHNIVEIGIKESIPAITAQHKNEKTDHVEADKRKGERRRGGASTKLGNKSETVVQSVQAKQDQNASNKEGKIRTDAEFSNATVITPSEETAKASEKPTKDFLCLESEDVSCVSTLDTCNEERVRKPTNVRASRRASLANQTAANFICSETLRIQARRSIRNNRSSVGIVNQRKAQSNFSNRSKGGSDVNSNSSTLHESSKLQAESPSSEATESSLRVSEAAFNHKARVQFLSSPGKGENGAQSISPKEQAVGSRKQKNERLDTNKKVSMSSSKRDLDKKDLEERAIENTIRLEVMDESPEEMTLKMINDSPGEGTPKKEMTNACMGENLVLEVNQRADSLSRKPLKKDEKFVDEVFISEPDSLIGCEVSISVHSKSGEVSSNTAYAIKSNVSSPEIDEQYMSPRSTYSTISGNKQCPASQLVLEFESSEGKDCEKSKILKSALESNQLGCWEEKLDEEEGARSLKVSARPGDCFIESSTQDEKELQVYDETHRMHLTEDIEDDVVIFDEYFQSKSDIPTSESHFEMAMQNFEELLQQTSAFGTCEPHNASAAAVTHETLHVDRAALSDKETLESRVDRCPWETEEAVADPSHDFHGDGENCGGRCRKKSINSNPMKNFDVPESAPSKPCNASTHFIESPHSLLSSTYLANNLEVEVCFFSDEEKMPKNIETQALCSYNEVATCDSYLQLDKAENQPEKLMPIDADRAIDTQIRLYGGANNAMEEVCCSDGANLENDKGTQTLCSSCLKEETSESRLLFDEAEVQAKKLLPIDQFQTVETDFTQAGHLQYENNVMGEVCSSVEAKMEDGETEALCSSFVEVQTSKSYLLLDEVEAHSENLLSIDDLQTGANDKEASPYGGSKITSKWEEPEINSELHLIMEGENLTAEPSLTLNHSSSHEGKEEEYILEQEDALDTKENQFAEILPFEWADSGDGHIDGKSGLSSGLDHVEIGSNSLASIDDVEEVSLVCNKTNSEGISEAVKEIQSPQLGLATWIESNDVDQDTEDKCMTTASQQANVVPSDDLECMDCTNNVSQQCNHIGVEATPKQVQKELLQLSDFIEVSKVNHMNISEDHMPEAVLDLNAELLQPTLNSIFSSEAEVEVPMKVEGKLSDTGVLLASFTEVPQQDASKLGEEGIQDLNDSMVHSDEEGLSLEGDSLAARRNDKLCGVEMENEEIENKLCSFISRGLPKVGAEVLKTKEFTPSKLAGIDNLSDERRRASDNSGDCKNKLGDLQVNANHNSFHVEEIEDVKDCEDAASMYSDETSFLLTKEDMPEPTNPITIAEVVTMDPPSHVEEVSEEASDSSPATNAKTLSLAQYKHEVEQSALQSCHALTIENFLAVSTSKAECSISETPKGQSFCNEHLKTSVDCILATVGSIMAVKDTSSRSIQLKRLALEKAENSIDAVVNALAERCQLAGIGKGSTWLDAHAEIVGAKDVLSQTQELVDAKLNSAIKLGVNSSNICGTYTEMTPIDGVKVHGNEVTPDKVIQDLTNQSPDYNLRISSNKVDQPENMVPCSQEKSFGLDSVKNMLCRIPSNGDELLGSDENGTTKTEDDVCDGSEVNQGITAFKPDMVLNLDLDTANEPAVRRSADDTQKETNLLISHSSTLDEAEVLDKDNFPSVTLVPSHIEPVVESNELKECKKQLQGYFDQSSCSQDPTLFRTDSNASDETKNFFSAVSHQDKESIPTTTNNKLMPTWSVEPTFPSTKSALNLDHVKAVDFHGKENIVNDSDLNRLSLRKLKALCKEKTATTKFCEGRKTVEKEERRAVLTPVHVNIMGRGASNHLPENYKH